MYPIPCTLYPMPCTLYPVPCDIKSEVRCWSCTLCPVPYALYPVPFTLRYQAGGALLVLYPIPCTLYPVPCTLYPAISNRRCAAGPVPCTLYPIPCTLYPVPCTLYPVPCTLRYQAGGVLLAICNMHICNMYMYMTQKQLECATGSRPVDPHTPIPTRLSPHAYPHTPLGSLDLLTYLLTYLPHAYPHTPLGALLYPIPCTLYPDTPIPTPLGSLLRLCLPCRLVLLTRRSWARVPSPQHFMRFGRRLKLIDYDCVALVP